MDEQALRKMLEGGGGGIGGLVRAVLKPPGLAYGLAMGWRRRLYESGVFSSGSVDAPVVSVGNLTAGGSGKTPMVILLAEMCEGLGARPGVVLRGYRAEDGLSDEAELYRRRLPGVVVEEGADRLAAARRAVERGAKIVLLDDGFQHLRLQRDLDVVLVDALSPWGGGAAFPGGLLREPRAALSRAGAVVVTRSDQVPADTLDALDGEIRRLAPEALLFRARHRPKRLLRFPDHEADLTALTGKKVVALCGIARPEAFALTLEGLGAEVADIVAVGDHRGFDSAVIGRAADLARRTGAWLITTEKDAVKKNFPDLVDTINVEAYVLAVGQELDNPFAMEALLRNTALSAKQE